MPILKPSRQIYRPSAMPGVQVVAGLTEGQGVASVIANGIRKPLSYTGAPTWSNSLYGPCLKTFTSGNYAESVPVGPITYPLWSVALYQDSSATNGFICAFGQSANANAYAGLRINNTAGNIGWWLKDDSGSNNPSADGAAVANSGSWNVAQGWSLSASLHFVALNGKLIASSTATLTTASLSTFDLGALRRSSVGSPFAGSIAFAAAGYGGPVPGAWSTYVDLINGRFSVIRGAPSRRRRGGFSGYSGVSLASAYPVFPDSTPRPRRPSWSAYAGLISPLSPADALQPSGSPVFPDRPLSYRRSDSTSYAGLISPLSPADALQPSGSPVFPDRTRTQIRQSGYTVVPAMAASVATYASAYPVFPDKAIGYRRSSPSAYLIAVSAVPQGATDLGRFRQGDTLSLQLSSSAPAAPVSVIVSGPSGIVSSTTASTRNSSLFTWSTLLGVAYPPGTYTVSAGTSLSTFTVVPGGDPEGSLIGLFHQKSPVGWITIAQTQSGDLVVGKRARID